MLSLGYHLAERAGRLDGWELGVLVRDVLALGRLQVLLGVALIGELELAVDQVWGLSLMENYSE